jgi:hypothetical protein
MDMNVCKKFKIEISETDLSTLDIKRERKAKRKRNK